MRTFQYGDPEPPGGTTDHVHWRFAQRAALRAEAAEVADERGEAGAGEENHDCAHASGSDHPRAAEDHEQEKVEDRNPRHSSPNEGALLHEGAANFSAGASLEGSLVGDSSIESTIKPLTLRGATADCWDHFQFALELTEDLLPVVSKPDAKISARSSVKEIGKLPSIYNAQHEVIGFAKWTEHRSTSAEIGRWRQQSDYGICLQTRHVRALDVDITDLALAKKVRDFVEKKLGRSLPCRSRANSSKFLLAFRLEGDFSRRKMLTSGGVIEFLANGQQFVAIGTHPSGARYEWDSGLPQDIPELGSEAFESLWSALSSEFAIEPPTENRKSGKAEKEQAAIGNDPIAQLLINEGWVRSYRKDGALNIRCPFESEHTTDSGETATVYYLAHTGHFSEGAFKCMHAHCEGRSKGAFIAAIGYMADDFANLSTTGTALELLGRDFAPMRWVVPNILPEGVYLLIAAPKVGKSFLALQLLFAVATDGEVLGQTAEAGSALYLALEDNERRLQTRLKLLAANQQLTDVQAARLHYKTEWPRSNEGGADQIVRWLDEHPDARLVVVDVLVDCIN